MKLALCCSLAPVDQQSELVSVSVPEGDALFTGCSTTAPLGESDFQGCVDNRPSYQVQAYFLLSSPVTCVASQTHRLRAVPLVRRVILIIDSVGSVLPHLDGPNVTKERFKEGGAVTR